MTELIREPGKFQPGRLGDLLYILQIANIRLLEMGSDHVRTGITNQGEINLMALATRDALGMWSGSIPCKDFSQIMDHLGQDQILENLRWCDQCGKSTVGTGKR